MATLIIMPLLISKNDCSWSFERKATLKSGFYCYSSASTNSLAFSFKQQTVLPCDTSNKRRFKPSIWDFEYIQSLKSEYSEERFGKRVNELKSQLRMMLDQHENPIDQLEFIDDLQRLGNIIPF